MFAVLIFVAGAGMGLFSAPNAAAIMNSVPARQRGAASGMLATFQNSGFVLSIGVFFSLMIAGLASALPTTLSRGLIAQGVPSGIAHQIAGLPPVGSLFAAFLGINPIRQLLAPTGALAHLPAASVARLTGKQFFPQLISGPFHHGLVIVFSMAIVLLVIAAGISALRGGRYVHDEQAATLGPGGTTAAAAGLAAAQLTADPLGEPALADDNGSVPAADGTATESGGGRAGQGGTSAVRAGRRATPGR
jgi:MFS family permease